jgi:hypothetical protein
MLAAPEPDPNTWTPGPATKQVHVLVQILASFIEMRDSLSKSRAVKLLDAFFAALERFTASRRAKNPQYISKEEIHAIAEAGGVLIRSGDIHCASFFLT